MFVRGQWYRLLSPEDAPGAPAPAAPVTPTPAPAAPVALVPAAPAPPVAPIAPAVPRAPISAGIKPDEDALPPVGSEGWLKARMERATESGEKKARKELKADRQAAKAAAREAVAVTATAQAELAAAGRFAEALLADVPEAARAQLKIAAGGNIAKTLELLTAYKMAHGGAPLHAPAAPPAPVAPVVPGAPPVIAAPAVQVVPALAPAPALAAPANTALAGGAPPPAGVQGPDNHAQTYAQLKETNPYAAAQYLLNNTTSIFPNVLRPPNVKKQ